MSKNTLMILGSFLKLWELKIPKSTSLRSFRTLLILRINKRSNSTRKNFLATLMILASGKMEHFQRPWKNQQLRTQWNTFSFMEKWKLQPWRSSTLYWMTTSFFVLLMENAFQLARIPDWSSSLKKLKTLVQLSFLDLAWSVTIEKVKIPEITNKS